MPLCRQCEKQFPATREWQAFCSQQCRNTFHSRKQDTLPSIYIIHAPELDVVKIGISKEPKKRLLQLQVGSPAKLVIIGTAELPAEEIYAFEADILSILASRRKHGEWFHCSLEEAIALLRIKLDQARVKKENNP